VSSIDCSRGLQHCVRALRYLSTGSEKSLGCSRYDGKIGCAETVNPVELEDGLQRLCRPAEWNLERPKVATAKG
jgi:hypothetical protein